MYPVRKNKSATLRFSAPYKRTDSSHEPCRQFRRQLENTFYSEESSAGNDFKFSSFKQPVYVTRPTVPLNEGHFSKYGKGYYSVAPCNDFDEACLAVESRSYHPTDYNRSLENYFQYVSTSAENRYNFDFQPRLSQTTAMDSANQIEEDNILANLDLGEAHKLSEQQGNKQVQQTELMKLPVHKTVLRSDTKVSKAAATVVKRPTIKTSESETGQMVVQRRANLERLLTGSVERVFNWSRIKNGLQILFEVIATLDAVSPGKYSCEKQLLLRDSKTGPVLQVVYYEIDQALPTFAIGAVIKCIGKPIGRNRLQAFKVTESSGKEQAEMQRAAFICSRAVQQAVSNKNP